MTTVSCKGARRIVDAINEAGSEGRKALAAFLTAGYPTHDRFADILADVADEADLIEIGVPFSDPVADGVTIQQSSRIALDNGTTIGGILSQVSSQVVATPLILMSYLNPLLAYGLRSLAQDAAAAGISGLIVPDLPCEESAYIRTVFNLSDIALIQLVSPVSSRERIKMICDQAQGFVYAVTVTGVTGHNNLSINMDLSYLDEVRSLSQVPVLAGFGIRNSQQFKSISQHADGVIVGSALLETLNQGGDPGAFLRQLKNYGADPERIRT